MKITVTGAAGRVGAELTRTLVDRGHTVTAVDLHRHDSDLAGASFVTADLTSYDRTCAVLDGAEAVVHLAGINAPVVAPEWKVHNTNVVASYNVLSACAELGIRRVVQSSSVNAIGLAWSRRPEFDYFPVDIAHPTRNEDGYSLSKLVQELQADSLTRRHEHLSVISLRLHAVLGEAADADLMIARLGASWAINGLFGYCTRSSVSAAVELACTTGDISGHHVLWVAEPETFATSKSRDLTARHFPDVTIREPFEGHCGFFDISRTRDLLGWIPSTVADPPLRRADI